MSITPTVLDLPIRTGRNLPRIGRLLDAGRMAVR